MLPPRNNRRNERYSRTFRNSFFRVRTTEQREIGKIKINRTHRRWSQSTAVIVDHNHKH